MEVIDFDLELAKKITSGEIKGEVVYYRKGLSGYRDARIISFDFKLSRGTRGVALITTLDDDEYIAIFDLNPAGVIDKETKLKLRVPLEYALKPGDFISDGSNIGIFDRVEDDLVFTIATYKTASHVVCVSECLCGINYVKRVTQAERTILLRGLKENGYEWNVEKLKLEDLKRRYQFKPFDRVIGKTPSSLWVADIFRGRNSAGRYSCIGGVYDEIAPFEGNEHLLSNK